MFPSDFSTSKGKIPSPLLPPSTPLRNLLELGYLFVNGIRPSEKSKRSCVTERESNCSHSVNTKC